MKTGRTFLIATALGLAAIPAATAQVTIVEPIGAVTLFPGQPIWMTFPNTIDPHRSKHMYFEGSAYALGTQEADLRILFDYHRDPADPPLDDPTFSPRWDFPIAYTGTPIFAEWWINECPPWVSVHFETSDLAVVDGVFVHQCVVPEPAHLGLVGALSMVACGVVRRRLRS